MSAGNGLHGLLFILQMILQEIYSCYFLIGCKCCVELVI
uniref:Uncharacterized protein n=1 Tax=Rhizophora mucronata TaxID=61149 RepID=A0A2P2NP80_RHIMU